MKHRYTLFILIPIFLLLFQNNSYAQLDFGDAPPPYPTLFANNGAYHMVGMLFLGNLIDSDVDGQPNIQSSGDDNMSFHWQHVYC